MCCPNSSLRELPVEQTDYFTYYGRTCVCLRLCCRSCGSIQLESHYVAAHGDILPGALHPPAEPVPFVMSKEAVAYLERKHAKVRACQHALRRNRKVAIG